MKSSFLSASFLSADPIPLKIQFPISRSGGLEIKIPPHSGFVDIKRSDRPIAIKIK